jgi:pimeloyl-ACP methyl ester carboxylesterase
VGLWTAIAVVATLVTLAWVMLAYKSGTFIPDDARYAIAPGEFTPDAMAANKKLIDLGGQEIACIDIGRGEPVILLHGCPFSVFEWHRVAPLLAKHFRVIAPDLIGLGDTPVRLNDDYGLPQDVKMVTGLMERLEIHSAQFIGHDHGGAIVQLLMQHHPHRIDRAILTNVEAYDQWPVDRSFRLPRDALAPGAAPSLLYCRRRPSDTDRRATQWLRNGTSCYGASLAKTAPLLSLATRSCEQSLDAGSCPSDATVYKTGAHSLGREGH